MMKWTAILFTMLLLLVCSEVVAQKVTITGKQLSLVAVFRLIKKQTGYVLFSSKKDLEQTKPVTIAVSNMPLKDFLELILKDQPLEYAIRDKTIVLSRRKKVSVSEGLPEVPSQPLAFHDFPIRVRIVDEKNQPLSGATIANRKSHQSGITDAAGILLAEVAVGDVLEVSFVGYEQAVRTIKDATPVITIKMHSADRPLEEVVVNKGYYDERKEYSTGSVSTVRAVDIEKSPVENVLQAIGGRVSGMYIRQQSGIPGLAYDVEIRGRNSIANSDAPLYVVDGVPVQENVRGNSLMAFSSLLNSINPANIASIDVLKDADATAIYGSRGANGVILITTKKGEPGRMRVSLTFYQGFAHLSRALRYLPTEEFLALRREAFANDHVVPSTTNAPDLTLWDAHRNVDWVKELAGHSSSNTNAQISFSGGTARASYFVNYSYNRITPPFEGHFADSRHSVQVSVHAASEDQKLRLKVAGNYSAGKNTLPSNDPYSLRYFPPNAPALKNADGSLNWIQGLFVNPYVYLQQPYQADIDNLVGNMNLSYKLLKGLEITAALGYSKNRMEDVQLNPSGSLNPAFYPSGSGNAVFGHASTTTVIAEPRANYKSKLGEGVVEVVAGATWQQSISDHIRTDASAYSSDLLLGNIAAAGQRVITINNYAKYRYQAAYARIGYTFRERYVLNLTGRRDGSSRFGPERQFAHFGSVVAAWIFTREAALRKALDFLSLGKLRISYGTTGNDQIGDYRFLDSYTPVSGDYLGVSGLRPSRIYNPDYGWETNKKLDVAVELGAFNNKFSVEVNYYRSKAANMLLDYTLAPTTGNTGVQMNLPAIIINKGVEVNISNINLQTKNVFWKTTFNITTFSNRLKSYPDLDKSTVSTNLTIGQPLDIVKVYRFAGVDVHTGAYTFQKADGTLTGLPDVNTDRTAIVKLIPDFYGGMQNTISWKGLSLDLSFQFVKKQAEDPRYTTVTAPGSIINMPDIVHNRWRVPGQVADIERATVLYSTGFARLSISDRFYRDASYVRLNNLSLTYKIPEGALKRAYLSKAHVFCRAQNLFTLTRYPGDPEVGGSNLPVLRSINVGFQATF